MKDFKWLLLMLFVLLMAGKCDPDGCKTEETRCNGTSVEVCDGEANWGEWIDCGAISGNGSYTCCFDPTDQTHSCLTTKQCEVFSEAESKGGE